MTCGKRHAHRRAPDMEETKGHILAAGKELLLAAKGALLFCKDYVENQVPESSRPELVKFFQKAMSVADELGKGISSISSMKRAAENIVGPVFTAMAKEMKRTQPRAHRAKRGKKAKKR